MSSSSVSAGALPPTTSTKPSHSTASRQHTARLRFAGHEPPRTLTDGAALVAQAGVDTVAAGADAA